MVTAIPGEIDPKWYRQVLAQYPTGVCVITSITEEGMPLAMIVGSFTSVSLSPPLVAFFPARDSNTWAKLRECPSFCVNILSSDQEAICRKLSSKDADKFANMAHGLSSAGNPILDGVVAWIDCTQHSVSEAGDHDMVLGRVLELDIANKRLPLLFFQGGYGRFSPASLAALDSPVISQSQLKLVNLARPFIEASTLELSAGCIATVRSGTELVIAASAGMSKQDFTQMLIGQRLPFYPPTGAVFAAWLSSHDAEQWLDAGRDEVRGAAYRLQLGLVRKRGYSIGLLNDAQRVLLKNLSQIKNRDYESHHPQLQQLIAGMTYDPSELSARSLAAVRLISVPIFNDSEQVVMALTLHAFPKPRKPEEILQIIARLQEAAHRITGAIGGRLPGNDN